MLFYVCVMTLGFDNKPSYVNCGQHSQDYLDKAKAACELAQKDPVGSCEILHTSDGGRWFFVHGGLK